MLRLERDLYNFYGINLEMTLLHARLTACYSLNGCTSCLCVLTSLDKIAAVGDGSGTTEQMPVFLGVMNFVTQWVLNKPG